MTKNIFFATAIAASMVAQTQKLQKITTVVKHKADTVASLESNNNNNKFLAKIGNEYIHQSDFKSFLKFNLNNQQIKQLQETPSLQDQYLNQFIDLCIMAAKAKKDGINKKSDYLNKMSIIQTQLLAEELMERDSKTIKVKATVTDDEMKAYFESNKDKFKTPETFSARHILISNQEKTDSGHKLLTDEEINIKISKVREELNSGKNFVDVAKDYSDDPGSKNNGGLYENIAFGQFVPEFEKAVRSQAIGQIGEPVKTQYGYHIIEVKKITPSTAQTFDEAKALIQERLSNEHLNNAIKAYLDQLKKEMGYKKIK